MRGEHVRSNKAVQPYFTLGFKQDAAKLMNEKGFTYQQAADNLGISLSAIGRWSRAERGSATASTPKTAALNFTGQAELLRLRKENEQFRMEHEILKKATASLRLCSGQVLPRKSNKVRGFS
jgi:transposase